MKLYRCYFDPDLFEGVQLVVYLTGESERRVENAAVEYGKRNNLAFLYKEEVGKG